jgi:hypothetical protein
MFEPRTSAGSHPRGNGNPHPTALKASIPSGHSPWACSCGRLLGVLGASRLHLKLHSGDEYLVGFPTTCKCRKCGSLNEVSGVQDVLRGRRAAGGGR